MNSQINSAEQPLAKPAVLLSCAFRPFFLLASLLAILAIAAWVAVIHGAGPAGLTPYWHAHEMVVGFAMAAVAGFSLTAVAVWTGRPVVQGAPIGLLILCWLAGRLAMAMPGALPAPAVMVLDGLFPVLLCVLFGREVISARNRRNYGLVAVLALMALVNLNFHLALIQQMPINQHFSIYILIHCVLLLVATISGRITPAFTRNWMKQQGMTALPVTRNWLDKSALTLTVLTGLSAAAWPQHSATGVLALLAALAHGYRLSAWRGFATTSNPLLFVLHAGYSLLPLAYTILALSVFGLWFTPSAATHALTMGAIGSVVLAVITRVSLGHTGRPLVAPRLIVFAYWLMLVAVVFRLAGFFKPEAYLISIDLAAGCWILAFALFIAVYWPILTRPKPQAKPVADIPLKVSNP